MVATTDETTMTTTDTTTTTTLEIHPPTTIQTRIPVKVYTPEPNRVSEKPVTSEIALSPPKSENKIEFPDIHQIVACQDRKNVRAKENERFQPIISCTKKTVIQINELKYGRWDPETCSARKNAFNQNWYKTCAKNTKV